MAIICEAGFENFMNGTVIPLAAYATVFTGIMIALGFMVGRAIANPKLTLWARTEFVQIIISFASVFFIIMTLNTMCGVNVSEVGAIFDIPTPASISVYAAAQEYLREAGIYSHNAMTVVRYHLEAYTVLSYMNLFSCDFSTGHIGWGCLFGYSGTSLQPFGGYGASLGALNIAFNSTIVSHFTVLNYLFILLYVYKGFVFFFLPLGIFLRSMPYMRAFGSLLVSIAISFLVVYPIMLSVLYLMGDGLVDRSTNYIPDSGYNRYLDETIFPDQEGVSGAIASAGGFGGILTGGLTGGGQNEVFEIYFPSGENIPGALSFAAKAFIAAVFMPSVALLATIASVVYVARLYGQEVDLNRITQLV